MNRDEEKKKAIRDQQYWERKQSARQEYADNEEQWKKDLIKLNPETPKPYHKP